jgi:hypothetical protein
MKEIKSMFVLKKVFIGNCLCFLKWDGETNSSWMNGNWDGGGRILKTVPFLF